MFSVLPYFRRSLEKLNKNPSVFFRRCKKFDARENVPKQTNITRALDHFDDFYGKFYGKLWPSIRLALLSRPKYCALVNYYGDHEETVKNLQNLGCVSIQTIFKEAQSNNCKKKRKYKIKEQDTSSLIKEPQSVENELTTGSDRIILPGNNTAAFYNFVPTTKIKGMEDYVQETDQLIYYQQSSEFEAKVEPDGDINFPPLLEAYMFPRGEVSNFPPPRNGSVQTLNYYCMDAASLLPVLALNMEPLDSVLDLCAAPGGKTLAILQTLYPNLLVSNDVTPSRVSRIRSVLNQYLGQSQSWKNYLAVNMHDALRWEKFETFDKVLVDVPCTNDRHSLTEEDNSIFKPTRMKERIKLPEIQTGILCAGVRACKPGGTIVYSTCSLSPIQNDGVVYMALKTLKKQFNIDVVVQDISESMHSFSFMVRWAPNELMRYGQQVIPCIPNNFGPMYIAKLKRVN